MRDSPNLLACVINALWFGMSFMWNAVHPIILPVLLLSYGEGAKNTRYGLLTFVGLVVALLAQPVFGALSDRATHRLGRRRPWIIVGVTLNLVFFAWMMFSRRLIGVAASYLLLQLSSNAAHGPGQALIPDLIPDGRRGFAAGLKSVVDMLGVIAAALLVGRTMTVESPNTVRTTVLLLSILTVSALITVLGTRESPLDQAENERPLRLSQVIRETFAVRLRDQGDYARLLLSRYFVLLGTYALQSFGLYFFRDVHRVANPTQLVGNLMSAIGVSVLLAALPAGILSERWGRKPLCVVAGLVTLAGMILLATLSQPQYVIYFGVLIGLGMGVFTSVNWAWGTDLVPRGEAGKFLGLGNLATAGAAATARLMGPIIDLVNRQQMNAGYAVLFVAAIIAAAASVVVTLTIRETSHV